MNVCQGPAETLVSSIHGNTALSDAKHPVVIAHYSQGALIKPPSSLRYAADKPSESTLGKVHFPLPTLRCPEEETPRGSLAAGCAIVSTALEVAVAPGLEPRSQDGREQLPPPLHRASRIIHAEIYAGRELLWSSDSNNNKAYQQQGPLPADRDFKMHIESIVYGHEDIGMRFNDNRRGLLVTLTLEFRGENPGLMVSSVALVQMMGSRKLQT
jgi:hypothetical protein